MGEGTFQPSHGPAEAAGPSPPSLRRRLEGLAADLILARDDPDRVGRARWRARVRRERTPLQRAAADRFWRREPGDGGGAQAARDALSVRRAPRETETRGGSDAALSLRGVHRLGRRLPSPHVVANLLGSLLEHRGPPRAAFRRPPDRALVGRQAPWRRTPALLGRSWSLVRLRGFATPAPRRRQECDRRDPGVTKSGGRSRRRLA